MLLTCIRTKFPFGDSLSVPPARHSPHPGPDSRPSERHTDRPTQPRFVPPFRQPESPRFRRIAQLPHCPFGQTFRHPPSAHAATASTFRPLVREICNQAPNPSLRPTYREVTACGGTFPDTVTYLHGLNTPIGPVSFRETRSPQAPHLPENGTFIQNRRICGFQAVARSPLPAPAAATSWLS